MQLTMREVMKILQRHVRLGLSLLDAVLSLLAPRVDPGSSAAQQLETAMQDLGGDFASVQLPKVSDYRITSHSAAGGAAAGVRFAMSANCYVDVAGADVTRADICSQMESMPAGLRAALVHVAFAVAAGEPVMLMGPTCFKSSVVKAWVDITGQHEQLVKVHLSPGRLLKCWWASIVLFRSFRVHLWQRHLRMTHDHHDDDVLIGCSQNGMPHLHDCHRQEQREL
jgi:hypothetical protein